MFELVGPLRAENPIPDIDVYGENKNHDADVDLSSRDDSHSVMDQCLEIDDEPVFGSDEEFLLEALPDEDYEEGEGEDGEEDG